MKAARHRTPTRLAAIGLLAAFGAVACESQPSAQRVARDIIQTLAASEGLSEAEEQCMLERLDEYDKDELQDIGNDVNSDNAEVRQAAVDELLSFESDLSDCIN